MASKSNAFKEHKKKLAARKSKLHDLERGIEQHESEREEASRNKTSFNDPKYASGSSTRSWGTDDDDDHSSVTSSAAAENEIDRMFGTESKKKKGKKKIAAGPKVENKKQTPATPKGRRKSIAKGAEISKAPRRLSVKPGASKPTANKGSKPPTPAETIIEVRKSDDTLVEIDSDEEESDEEGFLHIIEALQCFENQNYIFLQRLLDFVEIEAKTKKKTKNVDLAYQVLNLQGQLLFLLQQNKMKYTGFIVYSKKSFENILYDVNGNKVLKYIGPSVFMSKMTSKMIVTDARDRMLGYIKAFGTKVNYSVYNAIGERLFLVVSNLYIPTTTTNFTILCRGQKIGVIRCGWKHTFHDLSYIDYETSGIEFPSEMDDREKALLLGCLMLIEFFWYSPLTRLKLSLLFVGLLILTLAIIIFCIPFIIDNPGDHPITKSFYVAEKLDKLKKNARRR